MGQLSVSNLDVKLDGYVLQFCITEMKVMTYNVTQYHLHCVALEQDPMKWVCEACDTQAKVRTEAMSYYHIRNCA